MGGVAKGALAIAALLSGAALGGPARAGAWVDEIKGGVFLHDVGAGNEDSDSLDFNVEVNFVPLPLYRGDSGLLGYLFNPRPLLGASVNTELDTNRVYAGLSWEYELESGFFINPTFGIALHDGNREGDTEPCPPGAGCALPGNRRFESNNEPSLGTAWLFRESLEIGYRFGGRHAVSLLVAHISNAGFDDDNDGMNFIGLRYGLKLP